MFYKQSYDCIGHKKRIFSADVDKEISSALQMKFSTAQLIYRDG